MNTIQLECFLAVAEHLNFSRASEVLRITQPAVSHQIQSLEEELDVKLFKRTSKSVSLTQEGIQFLPDAQLILKTALSAKERLGQHEQFIPFELGCHNRMELNLLPPILKKLTEFFPLLRPVIQIVPFPSLLSQVENKQVHAAFGIKEEQKKSSLYFRELCSAPMACICSPGHPLAQYDSLTKDQLSGSIIACSPRQIADPIFSIQNSIVAKLRPEQRYFSENMESALTLVKAQIGYTLYPDIIAAREPDLTYIPVTDIPKMSFGVYYRYDDDHPVLRRFLMLCRELGT
ncbi:LysR family transcriptional regulator [Mediterraneibacter catenae]|uniref:LysR family transcriptional regulator n=1 Tax=Mediterraneibacter catenae TaxID=2594882 RepID=A0A5M9HZQ3_9FIRM|nr:LysR family transcriptional regulator [Mediterraneibacter catenae]KAA8502133.1 LysR family transcriptional regulator [Mediterraneibacter catenae]